MKRRHLPLHALRAFEGAARHRNLVRAAEELGVTHGAISQQIRSLESLFGRPLFDRKRRPLGLTPAGDQLLAVVSESFDRLARAADAVGSGELQGEISISCVPGLAANWLVPLLGDFLAVHAGVSIHLQTEYWRHPNIADRVDVAISYGSAEHPGKRVVLLGHSDFYPVASPYAVARTHGDMTPAEIARHTLLHEYSSETWSRWFASAGLGALPSGLRGVTFDGAHLSLQAARAGYGIAMGDTPTVKTDLEQGRLVRVSPISVPAANPYYLIVPPQSATRPEVLALGRWLVNAFGRFRTGPSLAGLELDLAPSAEA